MDAQQCRTETNAALDANGDITPSQRETWWDTPAERLDGATPREAIEDEGKRGRVVSFARDFKPPKRSSDWGPKVNR